MAEKQSNKHCRRCETVKPLSDFSTRGKGAHGYLYHTNCKACQRITQKAYRVNHQVKLNARKRELYNQNGRYKGHARGWYQRNKSYFVKYKSIPENRSRIREIERQRRKNETPEQKEKRALIRKQSRAKHPNTMRAYRQRTKERAAELKRLWQQKNPEKRAAYEMRRRALKAGVPMENIDRAAIIKRDKSTCYLCGKKLQQREIHLEHVIPLARGGAHAAANLKVACAPCNYAKARYTPDEYLALRANKAH